MYIEIRVQWTIHKIGRKFKQCDKYVIVQELMIKIMYTFHTSEYHTYMC